MDENESAPKIENLLDWLKMHQQEIMLPEWVNQNSGGIIFIDEINPESQ